MRYLLILLIIPICTRAEPIIMPGKYTSGDVTIKSTVLDRPDSRAPIVSMEKHEILSTNGDFTFFVDTGKNQLLTFQQMSEDLDKDGRIKDEHIEHNRALFADWEYVKKIINFEKLNLPETLDLSQLYLKEVFPTISKDKKFKGHTFCGIIERQESATNKFCVSLLLNKTGENTYKSKWVVTYNENSLAEEPSYHLLVEERQANYNKPYVYCPKELSEKECEIKKQNRYNQTRIQDLFFNGKNMSWADIFTLDPKITTLIETINADSSIRD
ncbi:MAG: hypothetical protein KDD58_00940 [Bdellovibrionales bacterium]|nr:hypothetical protein [Bdellovibrionales bacterium]